MLWQVKLVLALVVGEDLPQQVGDATGRRTRFDLCQRVVAAEVREDVWLMPPPAPCHIMKALKVEHLQAVAVGVCQAVAVGVCQAVAKAEATG